MTVWPSTCSVTEADIRSADRHAGPLSLRLALLRVAAARWRPAIAAGQLPLSARPERRVAKVGNDASSRRGTWLDGRCADDGNGRRPPTRAIAAFDLAGRHAFVRGAFAEATADHSVAASAAASSARAPGRGNRQRADQRAEAARSAGRAARPQGSYRPPETRHALEELLPSVAPLGGASGALRHRPVEGHRVRMCHQLGPTPYGA